MPVRALRTCIAALALALAAAPLGAETPAEPEAAADEAPPPLTVAVVGDSLAGDYCRGLRRVLAGQEGFRVLCWAHPSSGLTRVDFFDWDATLAAYLAETVPDVAIVSMGANDAQRIVLEDRVLDFETDAWAEVYAARMDALLAQFAAAGSRVIWVGLPTASSSRYMKKLGWLNAIYEDRAAAGGADFVPLWERTSDASGRYVSTLTDAEGRERPARKSDGFHFSMDGETIVACTLAGRLPGVERAADLSRSC